MAKRQADPGHVRLQAYDGARKIADGLRGVKGNFKNLKNLVKSCAPRASTRSAASLKYNVNGFLIQPWYKRSVCSTPRACRRSR